MTKLPLSNIANLQNESTVVTTIATNNAATTTALENTLSRDGTSPNQMNASIDMNSHRVLNLVDALDNQEPATFNQLKNSITAVGQGAVVNGTYLTLSNNVNLLSNRVLTPGTNIGFTDSGATGTLTVGVNDIELNALSSTSSAADTVPYYTGVGTASVTSLPAYGRSLISAADAATARTTLGSVIGTNVQAWDNDLDAVAGLTTNGLIARTGTGTASTRTVTAPAAGITVSNGDGVAGNPTLALANDLSALEGLSGTGIASRSATDTWVQRTITGTANEITLTNGDGVAGNPTASLPTSLTFTGKTVTGGSFSSPSITTPTGIVKADVGLGNVDNTSDATKNAATATLTNKTITSPVISTITNTGTLTLPTSTDTLVGRATTDTLTNKSISGSTNTLSAIPLTALATQAAYTIVANNSGSAAAPTAMDVTVVTSKPAPVAADIVLIQDSAASNAFKRTTVGALASAGSVSSVGGATGAITVRGGNLPAQELTVARFDAAQTLTAAEKVQLRTNTGTAAVPSGWTRTVFTTGSGTYTVPTNCKALLVRLIGGGGGGGGGSTTGGAGTAGAITTFGTSLLSAGNGAGGGTGNNGASSGGTASGGDINLTGGYGQASPGAGAATAMYLGGIGGSSVFGGGGYGGWGSGGSGGNAITNTGGGGGGGGGTGTANNDGGAGGASGAYCEKLLTSLLATYAYVVGGGGGGGAAGATGSAAGGSGGSGVIIIDEYY